MNSKNGHYTCKHLVSKAARLLSGTVVVFRAGHGSVPDKSPGWNWSGITMNPFVGEWWMTIVFFISLKNISKKIESFLFLTVLTIV